MHRGPLAALQSLTAADQPRGAGYGATAVGAISSVGAPSPLRTAALRALSLAMSRPGAAERCFLTNDADEQCDDLWAQFVSALATAGSSEPMASPDLQTAHGAPPASLLALCRERTLALRACTAVLNDVWSRPLPADESRWQQVGAQLSAKSRLHREAQAFNADAKAAVARWQGEAAMPLPPAPVRTWGARGVSPDGDTTNSGRGDGEGAEALAGGQLGSVLFQLAGLSPQAVGAYLSSPQPLTRAALAAFMDCFDFHGLPLDAALRLVFAALHVPGEAQKVDRVIHAFASAYHRQQPAEGCVFADATAAYVMSFSTMLLNTDLHNPAVRNKMSAEQFVKNNKGINGGADLPRQYLLALYDAVARDEIKAHELAPPHQSQGQPPVAPSAPAPPTTASAASLARSRYLRQRSQARKAARGASPESRAQAAAPLSSGSCEQVQRVLVSQLVPTACMLATSSLFTSMHAAAAPAQPGAPHGGRGAAHQALGFLAHQSAKLTRPTLAGTTAHDAQHLPAQYHHHLVRQLQEARALEWDLALTTLSSCLRLCVRLSLLTMPLVAQPIGSGAGLGGAGPANGAVAAEAVLLGAMVRAVDESMAAVMRGDEGGGIAAATALTALAAAIDDLGSHAPPWAHPTAAERMARVLATHQCPVAVQHAAAHALERLRRRQGSMPMQTG